MTTEHPITPPPKLVQQWIDSTASNDCIGAYPANYEQLICTAAARWGADQELDAVCDEILHCVAGIYEDTVSDWSDLVNLLRDSRRPKPPSLKEQALEVLNEWCEERNGPGDSIICDGLHVFTIRRALEQLP